MPTPSRDSSDRTVAEGLGPPPDTSATDTSQSLARRVRFLRIQKFFELADGNLVNVAVAAFAIAVVLRTGGADAAWVWGWLGLLGLNLAVVIAYERQVFRAGLTPENSERVYRIRIGLGAAVSALYGASGFLLPSGPTLQQDTFLFIILSSVVTVSTLHYSAMPVYYLVIAATSLGPLTVHLGQRALSSSLADYRVLVGMAFLWQAIVLTRALRVSRSAIRAIELNERLQNEIVEHKRTKEAIRHLALHDPLTGLANRRHFEDAAHRSLAVAARNHSRVGLVVIDLDGFKPINDEHGHPSGDELLRQVATRLRTLLRATDLAARIGGDEFALLVENVTDDSDLATVAQKATAALAQPFGLDSASVSVGASLGGAIFPEDGSELPKLLRVADERMFQHKRRRKVTTAA